MKLAIIRLIIVFPLIIAAAFGQTALSMGRFQVPCSIPAGHRS